MKVLIADDHPIVRDALMRTVQLIDPGVSVLQAPDFAGVIAVLDGERPDLALIDLRMPGMEGIAGVRHIRGEYPGLTVVVASGEDDPAVVRSVLALGVAGYLPKSEPPEVHLQALRLVLAGGTYLPPAVIGDFRDGEPPRPQPDASGLTPRQLDVLRLLMRGEPNKLIARELRLAEGTVKLHIAAIRRALQARNRTEAVVLAQRLGFDPTD